MASIVAPDHSIHILLHILHRLLDALFPITAKSLGILLFAMRIQNTSAGGYQRAPSVDEGGSRHVGGRALSAVAGQEEEGMRQPLAQACHRLRLSRADDRAQR